MSDDNNNSVGVGIGFGTIAAGIISYVAWKSIGWMLVHAFFGWFYIIYYAVKYGFKDIM